MSSKKGKKNKRGERGSTEEDTRAGKKANMAASGMDTGIEEAIQMLSEESQEEPSLLEIKNVLIDIQIQLSTILKENRVAKRVWRTEMLCELQQKGS